MLVGSDGDIENVLAIFNELPPRFSVPLTPRRVSAFLFRLLLFSEPIISLGRYRASSLSQVKTARIHQQTDSRLLGNNYRLFWTHYCARATVITSLVFRVAPWLLHLVRWISRDSVHDVFCPIWTAHPDWLARFMIWPSFCIFVRLLSNTNAAGCASVVSGMTRSYYGLAFCACSLSGWVGPHLRPCVGHDFSGTVQHRATTDNQWISCTRVRS